MPTRSPQKFARVETVSTRLVQFALMKVRGREFRKVRVREVFKNPAPRKIVVRNRTIHVPGRIINFGWALAAGGVATGAVILGGHELIANVHLINSTWHGAPPAVQDDVPRVLEGLAFRSGMQLVLQKREKLAWVKKYNIPKAGELDDYIKRKTLESQPLTFTKRLGCYAQTVPWAVVMGALTVGGVALATQLPISPLHGVWMALPAMAKAHWVPSASGFGIRHGYPIATKPIRVDKYRRKLLAGLPPVDGGGKGNIAA